MDDPQSEPAKGTENDNVPRRRMRLAADGVLEIVATVTDAASHTPEGTGTVSTREYGTAEDRTLVPWYRDTQDR
jgi:hypothetical protein